MDKKKIVRQDPATRKKAYFERLTSYLQTYNKIMIIGIDNVGAAHLQRVRKQFRDSAQMLMGKKTLMRKCLRQYIDAGHPEFQPLMENLVGNVGLIFTNGDLRSMRNEVTAYRVPAPAKANVTAPADVHIPAGPTGLEPTATAFLQALNIPSKIVKGQVELTSVVHLIHKGERVKAGAAALLQKLKITPFSYGIEVNLVFNGGFVYNANLLDLTDRDVLNRFGRGLTRIAALGLQIGYPTLATVPHTIVNCYQNLLSIGLGTEYTFGPVAELKEKLANPDAFVTAPVVAAGEVKQEVAVVEEAAAESSDEGMDGMDLFG